MLLRETIELLAAERGGLFVDCTVGLGGHSEAILQASSDAQVLGIDRDEEALELARSDWRNTARAFAQCMLTFVNLRGSSRQRKSGRCAVFLLISVFRRCSWTRLCGGSVSGTTRRSTCAWMSPAAKPPHSFSVVFRK